MFRLRLCEQRNALLVFLTLLVIGTIIFYFYKVDHEPRHSFELTFIPANYQSCEQLLLKKNESGIFFSPSYNLKVKAFEEAVKRAIIGQPLEGYSGQLLAEYLVMHHLAGQSAVKTICETGFNMGHSSFSYLTANEHAIVHSFDLGSHKYAHTMASYLKSEFPSRFNIHFGDSTKTIPEFMRNNSEFRCDYMFVDGGHVFPVALADIKNFAQIANLDENIIIFDDYPTGWGASFGKAWEDTKREGIIKEITRCTFAHDDGLQRGFVIGRVIKRTQESNVTKP